MSDVDPDNSNKSDQTARSEEAVRSYLMWLEDPSTMRDQRAIDEVAGSILSETDPIARLKAISRLEELESVSGDGFRRAFVGQAKAWAESEGVSADAFRKLGVPAKDLRDAGFGGAKRSTGESSTPRRTRVSPSAVRESLPDGTFRIAEIEQRSGASTATVRKVILEMIDEGSVVDLGPDQQHSGRGRAPLTYRKH